MTLLSCVRESELSLALRHGTWPNGCASELRQHVAKCRTCSDLVLVAEALRSARAQSAATMRPQAPGIIWWRAQLRKRNAAIEQIDKPIVGAQLFALTMILAVGAAGLARQVRQGHGLMTLIRSFASDLHLKSLVPFAFMPIDGEVWILVPALATVVLLSGVVVYLASEKR